MKSMKVFFQKVFQGRYKWLTFAAVGVLMALAVSVWAATSSKMSRTAFVMMGYRAIGAQDPDPKTRNPDYLAARLLGQDGAEKMRLTLDFARAMQIIMEHKVWIYFYATARTKHIDASLEKELAAGAEQVVILGAGFDSRAYRYYKKHPKVRFIELDRPFMVNAKKKRCLEVLGPQPASLAYAPIDFNTQDMGQELKKAGYDPKLKTLFIWEGVSYYLDPAAVDATLRFIAGNSAPGSVVVFDYLPPAVVSGTYDKDEYAGRMVAFLNKSGESLRFGVDHLEMKAFLEKRGLKLKSNLLHADLVSRYMTGSNGKPFGVIPNFFCIANAEVKK